VNAVGGFARRARSAAKKRLAAERARRAKPPTAFTQPWTGVNQFSQ